MENRFRQLWVHQPLAKKKSSASTCSYYIDDHEPTCEEHHKPKAKEELAYWNLIPEAKEVYSIARVECIHIEKVDPAFNTSYEASCHQAMGLYNFFNPNLEVHYDEDNLGTTYLGSCTNHH